MASICKIGGKWRALIRKKGRPAISKRFDKKSQAETWAREIEDQLATGQAQPLKGATVGKMIKEYRKLRDLSRPILDTSTEHYTLKTLDRLLGSKSVYLTPDELIAFAVTRKAEGAGPYTVNCDVSKLGTVYRYAGNGAPDVIGAARGKLKYLGLIGGGGVRERRPEGDEFTRILEALEQPYRDATLFACITTMRQGEVTRIAWADVDEARRTVIIRDRKHPRQKKGNDEIIPLLGDSWDILQRQPRVAPCIFPVYPGTLSKKFTGACQALNIPDLHFHDLRHEGISAMFEQGFDIPRVALVSGHKSWNNLRRYTNLKPESLHDSPDKLPKL